MIVAESAKILSKKGKRFRVGSTKDLKVHMLSNHRTHRAENPREAKRTSVGGEVYEQCSFPDLWAHSCASPGLIPRGENRLAVSIVYQVYKGSWIFYIYRNSILCGISLFSTLGINYSTFSPRCPLQMCWGCWGYITLHEITNFTCQNCQQWQRQGFKKNSKTSGKVLKQNFLTFFPWTASKWTIFSEYYFKFDVGWF